MQRLQRRKCRWRLVAVALLVGGATVSAAQGGGRPAAAYQVMTAGDCTVVDAERAPDATESELLDIVNGYRQELGLPTLVPTASLMRAARWKAAALTAAPPVLLTGRDLDDADRTWQRRLRDCGYPAVFSVGEVLGRIPGGPDPAAPTAPTASTSPTSPGCPARSFSPPPRSSPGSNEPGRPQQTAGRAAAARRTRANCPSLHRPRPWRSNWRRSTSMR